MVLGWYFHFIGEESGAQKFNEVTLNSQLVTGRAEILNHRLQSPNILPTTLSSTNLNLAMFPACVSGGDKPTYIQSTMKVPEDGQAKAQASLTCSGTEVSVPRPRETKEAPLSTAFL